MVVTIFAHPSDERISVLTSGIKCLAETVRLLGFLDSAPTSGTVVLDDGSQEALSAVLSCARGRAPGAPGPVVVCPVTSAERRARLLAAGAARVLEGPTNGERVAAEIQALIDVAGPGQDRVRNELLQPFIVATIEAWSVMAGVPAKTVGISRKSDYRMKGDISALIYLVGGSERMLALNLGANAARGMTVGMLNGMVSDPSEDMITDSVGEMINIIAGQVKGAFVGTPYEFDISIPTVITGPGHEVRHRVDLPCFVMAFECPLGPFALQLCVRQRDGQG